MRVVFSTTSFAQTLTVESAEFTTATTYTWTCPAHVTSVDVYVWGAGGGGGGDVDADDGAGGGGGGALSMENITVTGGLNYTVIVGAGGAAGGAGDGVAGDVSYFISALNGTEVHANGGQGGLEHATAATGGAGGTAAGSGYTIEFAGGAGGAGLDDTQEKGGGGGSSAGYVEAGYVGHTSYQATNNATSSPGAAAPNGGARGGDGGSESCANLVATVGSPGGGGGGGAGYNTNDGAAGGAGKVVLIYNGWTEYKATLGADPAGNDYVAGTSIEFARVKLWGAGGGGGSCNSVNNSGGGGGGGAYSEDIIAVVAASTYNITVGTGGPGGATITDDGTNGGDSSFKLNGGGNTVLAEGGDGGGKGATLSPGAVGAGGTTGTALGDITNAGGSGGLGAQGVSQGGGGGGSAGRGGIGGDGDGSVTACATVSSGGAAGTDGGVAGADGTSYYTRTRDGDAGGAGGGGGGEYNAAEDDPFKGLGGFGGDGKAEVYWGPMLQLADNVQGANTDIAASATNQIIHSFILEGFNDTDGTYDTELTAIDWTTTGSYTTDEISNFELFWTTTNSFATTNSLGQVSAAGPGSETQFSFAAQSLTNSTIYYYWIVMDVAATTGNCLDITVSEMTYTDVTATFNSLAVVMDETETAAASGTQSFVCISPGGVAGQTVWIRPGEQTDMANKLINDGSMGDFSTIGGAAATLNSSTSLVNYNPRMVFDATSSRYYRTHGYAEDSEVTDFAVAVTDVNVDYQTMIGIDNLTTGLLFSNDAGALDFNTIQTGAYASVDVGKTYGIFGAAFNDIGASTSTKTLNGLASTFTSYALYDLTNAIYNTVVIGGSYDDIVTYDYEGDMYEVIEYNSELSSDDMKKVNSYLALKYGISMEGTVDYISSADTEFWDADGTHTGYENHIFGIGTDFDNSGLRVAQAKNYPDGNISVYKGTLETLNSSNTALDAVADDNFIMFGSNGLTTDYTAHTYGSDATVNARINEIWDIELTGTGITTFKVSTAGSYTDCTPKYVMVSSDPTFATVDHYYAIASDVADVNVAVTSADYMTIAVLKEAPGGVVTDLTMWFKADAGVYSDGGSTLLTTTGTNNAQEWHEQSGNTIFDSNQPADGTDKTSYTSNNINFNPSLNIVETNDGFDTPSNMYRADFLGTNTDEGTMYTVFNYISGAQYAWIHRGGNNTSIAYGASEIGQGTNSDYDVDVGADFAIVSCSRTTGTADNDNFLNGEENGTGGTNTNTDGTLPLEIGYSDFEGEIAEIIVYEEEQTAAERQKVETYLAIKYGITISTDGDGDGTEFEASNAYGLAEGDYISSDGLVVWNADDTTTVNYHNDVAGIAKDANADLEQFQSQSQNAGVQPIIGLGTTIAASNATHGGTFSADNSYLIWGHDNASSDYVTVFNSSPLEFRMTRVWKVAETGTIGNVHVAILKSDIPTNIDYPTLIVSSDETITAGVDTEYNMSEETIDGSVYYTCTASFDDGDYFTFAGLKIYPGGIGTNLVFWLRAGAGITESGNAISAWENHDETSFPAEDGSPTYSANSSDWNFHPIVIFDGDDDFMTPGGQTQFDATDPMTAYYAINTNDNTNEQTILENGTVAYPAFEINVGASAGKFGMDLTGTDFSNNGWHTSQSITDDDNYLVTSAFDNEVVGNIYNFLNGGNQEIRAGDTDITLQTSQNMTIGSEGTSKYLNGHMPELIIYDTYMTDAEDIAMIHSYLAIKYGVQIDQTSDTDYLNTAETVIWDASVNGAGGYKYNIAGLTLDIATGLDQKIAKSCNNTADILIMSLDDDFTSSNDDASRTTTFNESDLCHLLWGNDNGAADAFSATYNVGGSRMTRKWKLQLTNFSTTNNTPYVQFTDGDISNSTTYYLIGNTTDAATGWTTVSTATSEGAGNTITFDNVDFGSSIYFSLASDTPYIATLGSGTSTASVICPNGTEAIYDFTIAIDAGAGTRTISELTFVTSGTFAQADVDHYELYYKSSNDFSTAAKVADNLTPTGGTGTTEDFDNYTQTLSASATSYFWIAAVAAAGPTAENIISVDALTTSNLTMTGGTTAGSTGGGNTHVFGTSVYWDGDTDNNWSTAGNWCNAEPLSSTSAIIPNNAYTAFDCQISGAGEVALDITINTSGSLETTASNGLSVYGDWTNNGTYTYNTAAITFSGAANQALGNTAASQTFYDLIVNNTGADGSNDITLSDPVTVTNDLTLTNGILNTDATNLIDLTNTATDAATGGTNNGTSFVDGPIKWSITTGGTYIFPTGDGSTSWARVALSSLSAAGVFTCEYFRSAYSDVATMDADDAAPYPNNVSTAEYWDVTRNSGGNAKVTLYWADSDDSGIDDCSSDTDLMVAHFTSSEWRNANSSGTATTTGTCASSSGTIISDLQTTFSPFTFGSESGGLNPLPIELISFSAIQNNKVVDLDWTTASEINNDYFTVERSKNAIDFAEIATVGGAGNSNQILNYNTVDSMPLQGISYYRLKQTDFDGQYEYSEILSVNFSDNGITATPTIKVIPNPASNLSEVNVLLANYPSNSEVTIVLIDNLSKEYAKKVITTDDTGAATLKLNPVETIASGFYFLNVSSNNVFQSEPLIITE